MERRLKELDPDLHGRFRDTVFVMQETLHRYQRLFPAFTDHTSLHSLSVIDFCNRLIGTERLARMNADEIYVLLMSCYLHDVGMGISKKDYEEFFAQIDFGTYFDHNSREDTAKIIRDFHHEFSGAYIRKYAELLEIPSEEHTFAIIEVARGHRRTDLFDSKEYPADWSVPGGHTICLPYLAALIRLADEIDVAADRNPRMLYDIESMSSELEQYFFMLNQVCERLVIEEGAFIMEIRTEDPKMQAAMEIIRDKIQATLDLCRSVVSERTPYEITQKRVEIRWLGIS